MIIQCVIAANAIHCRVGSLEKQRLMMTIVKFIHCRVGSLENSCAKVRSNIFIHCRVGSLEMWWIWMICYCLYSLPSRQLRNH